MENGAESKKEEIYKSVLHLFQENLLDERTPEGKEYLLKEYGLQYSVDNFTEFARKEKLGFYPYYTREKPSNFILEALQDKFSPEQLCKADVIKEEKLEDCFRTKTILMPRNYNEEIYGIYGRSIGSVRPQYKHFRTQGSLTLKEMKGKFIITESEGEALILRSIGFNATAWNFAIKFKPETFSEDFEPLICFYKDKAGKHYTTLLSVFFIENGIAPKIINLKEKDPIETMKTHKFNTKEVFEEYINNAKIPIRTIFKAKKFA